MSIEHIKIDGVAYYAKVQAPEEGAYKVSIVVGEDTAKKLMGLGLNPARTKLGELKQFQDHPGKVFNFKSKTEAKDGRPLSPPRICDSKGNDLHCLIGNGSKVRLYASVVPYNFKGKEGHSGYFNALQVIDLVEYIPGVSVDKIDGGFEVKEESVDNSLSGIEDKDVF